MAIQQVTFEIPDEINQRILEGEYSRKGGIVRDSGGRIVLHLLETDRLSDEASLSCLKRSAATKAQKGELMHMCEVLGLRALDFAKRNKKALIVAGIAFVSAGAIGAIIHTTKKREGERTINLRQEKERSFNHALKSYLDSLNNRQLNEQSLVAVIESLDALKQLEETAGANDAFVCLTLEQLELLIPLLKEYTERFARANEMTLNDPPEISPDDHDSKIIVFRHYLEEQKRLMDAS